MKLITKLFGKILLICILFGSLTLGLNAVGVEIISKAYAAISQEQIVQYLNNRGYEVVSLKRDNTQKYSINWIAHTIKNGEHFTTTIYCSETEILGHGDVPF